MRTPVFVLAVTMLLGCGGAEPAEGAGTSTQVTVSPPLAAQRCTPPGLEGAQSVPTVTLPSGCSFTEPGTLSAPLVIANETDFAAHVRCVGASLPQVNFATHDVLLVGHVASPAYGGGAVLDDGARVSFVTMQRTPCPSDYPPMPTPMSFAFLLPKGATRTWGEAICTLAPHCP